MSGNAFGRDYASEVLAPAERLDGVDAYLFVLGVPSLARSPIDEALGAYRTHGGNVQMTSGKKTVRNLGDHIINSGPSKMRSVSPTRKVSPFRGGITWWVLPAPWLLLAKDGGYNRLSLPDQGRLLTTAVAVKAFLDTLGIEPSRRLKNIGLLAPLAILQLSLRCRIADRLFSDSNDPMALRSRAAPIPPRRQQNPAVLDE